MMALNTNPNQYDYTNGGGGSDQQMQILTFSGSFWGPENKGFETLLAKMKRSKRINEEIQNLLKEQAQAEEEFGKRMAKLAKNFTPLKDDKGTLLESLECLRNEMERSARSHLDLAQDLRAKLAGPFQEFIDSQAAVRKNHQRIMERNVQLKTAQEQYVLKCRDRYEVKCHELEGLETTLRGMLIGSGGGSGGSGSSGVPAKEIDKVKVKIERVQMQQRQADQDYRGSAEKLSDIFATWRADMLSACVDFEKLEEERYLFTRSNLWKYANFVSDTCVLNDQSAERIRVSLEMCNFDNDLNTFIETYATGTEVPEPFQYIPYQSSVTILDQRFQTTSMRDVDSPSTNNGSSGRDSQSSSRQKSSGAFSDGKKNSVTGIGHLFSFQQQGTKGRVTPPPQQQLQQQQSKGSISSVNSNQKRSGGIADAIMSKQPAVNERSFIQNSDNNNSLDTSSIANMDSSFLYDPFEVQDLTTILFNVKVLYDYKSQAREELDIYKDQIIPVFATNDDGWWEGLADENGRRRRGLFPSNFVIEL